MATRHRDGRRGGRVRAWIAPALALLLAVALLPAARAAQHPKASSPPAPVATKSTAATTEPLIAVLCYHDLSDQTGAVLQTVAPAMLRNQIRACRAAGWTFLSLADVLARRAQPTTLPPRVMVMTFDDGYRSFYEKALPILRDEHVPATVCVISSFVDHPPANLPPLMSWDQIRECDRTGIEVASHSHASHGYEVNNPWHDSQPAIVTRRWLLDRKRYETVDEYRDRLRADFTESQRVLTSQLGHPVTTMVWPFGQVNATARDLAHGAGFTNALTLGWREVRDQDLAAGCLPRIMVTRNLRFAGGSLSWLREPRGALRAARVNLDELWDPDVVTYRANLDHCIARLRAIGATHVFLDVCSPPEGRLLQAWYDGKQAPLKADLWSMAAAKFANAKLEVWAVAPTMNVTWVWDHHKDWRLGEMPPALAASAQGALAGSYEDRAERRWPTRLSPELPGVRRAIADLYGDMATFLPLDGVVFEDDATLLPSEALASNPTPSPDARANAVDGLIDAAEQAVRDGRPECRFARMVAGETVLSDGPSRESAQDFARIVSDETLVVVRADENDPAFVRDPARWIAAVGKRAMRTWDAEQKTRIAAAARHGIPRTPLETAPPVLLELPATIAGDPGYASRLPSLLATARRAGFESYVVGPLTRATLDAIPARALEGSAVPEREKTKTR